MTPWCAQLAAGSLWLMPPFVTVPIGRLHQVDGIAVIVALVVMTEDDMTLHMTLQPCPNSFLDWWDDPRTWRVDDGLGTTYTLKGASSSGSDEGCHASLTWVPAPPSAVGSLTFEAFRSDGVVLSQWANIAYYRERTE